MRILVVCMANMCRSPLLEHRLRAALADLPDLHVASAGTWAAEGAGACPVSAARIGIRPQEHHARRVTADDLVRADLVLAADRQVRGELARLAPAARPRTFTARQAAALADPVTAALTAGTVPAGAPALPSDRAERLRWVVAELDAARGSTPPADEDVPDPHVEPGVDHDVLALLDPVAQSLAGLLRRAVTAV